MKRRLEEVEELLLYNKPLEKAYKSLQRRYGKMADKLEVSQRL